MFFASLTIVIKQILSVFELIAISTLIMSYRQNKPSFDYNQYINGKRYCRRCETYFYYNGSFCPCCGMQLRLSPSSTKYRVGRHKQQRDKG
jgi:uncharacterized paraquat-inducible protein A